MKENNTKNDIVSKKPIISMKAVIALIIIPFIGILLCDLFKISDNEMPIRALMKIFLSGITVYAFAAAYTKKLTIDKALVIVMAAGIILRMGYMLYTPWGIRGHDVGTLDGNGMGHAAYILNNILKLKLPDASIQQTQFYHPPLYYILSGISIKLASILRNTKDYAALIKYAMAVSCAASCVMLVYIQKLADVLQIKRKYQLIAVTLAAAFPNFMLMGGRINNDALVSMFMVLSVYFTAKWYYRTEMKWIIGIALSVGLGMMTKISCGTVAVFIAPVMLYKLYLGYKDGKLIPMIKQLAVFAAICFPLALWYPIFKYVLYSQPLNFVLDLGEGSFVYTGNIPLFKRLFSAPVWAVFRQPYDTPGEDYSLFMIVTRTSVFGEFQYNVSKIVTVLLYFVNLALIIASLVSTTWICVKDKSKDWFSKYYMAAVWVVVIVSFMMFNISYPYACTADMRYIPLAFVSGCVYLSMAAENVSQLKIKNIKIMEKSLYYCVLSFAVLVAVMYA